MKENNFGSWFDLSYRIMCFFFVSILLFTMFYFLPTDSFEFVFGNEYSFDIDDKPVVTNVDKWLLYGVLVVILVFAATLEDSNFFVTMSIIPFIAVLVRFFFYSVIPFLFLEIGKFGWSILAAILAFGILYRLFRKKS